MMSEENIETQEVTQDAKIIQITFSPEGLPVVNYANLGISEVVGALTVAQEIVLQRKVNIPMAKDVLATALRQGA